jgi:hypothetical protein
VDLEDGELTFNRDEPQEDDTQLENGEEPQALEPVLN